MVFRKTYFSGKLKTGGITQQIESRPIILSSDQIIAATMCTCNTECRFADQISIKFNLIEWCQAKHCHAFPACYGPNMTSISVTELVQNFAVACRSLVPALDRADVPWQDATQYDNWDRIAEPLFESLVIEPCAYAAVGEMKLHTLIVPRYGFEPYGPKYNAWVTLEGTSNMRMAGLSSEQRPFDHVDLVGQDHRISIALDSASLAFTFNAPDLSEQKLTIFDLAAA